MVQTLQDTPTSAQTSTIDPRVFLLALGMFALGTDAYVVAGVLPETPRIRQDVPIAHSLDALVGLLETDLSKV